jgi:colanic acid biosynthesis glycosyl transferase WcaI
VVLSDDLRRNVVAKIGERHAHKVTVIPNFVDAGFIVPAPRDTQLRRELGIGDEPVVMYAGNVGFSQSLDLVIAAARRIPAATFVINGDGSERARLEASAAGVTNMRFSGYQPRERVPEVLATGDVHVVPLRAGLAAVSVPSKTYSILAAGRPVIAAIDEDTEIPRLLASSGAGVSVPPDDEERFVRAIEDMLSDPGAMTRMGTNGRGWVEEHVSPAAVAGEYLKLADRRR